MIPRLKPFTNSEEIHAILSDLTDAVSRFEHEFASEFNSKFAIAFPYGRSALWAFFRAMGIKDAEIVQPAYTCSVVAHATVLSGNIPRFVDSTFHNYNMDLELFQKAITKKTRAVIPTHLFGYPMDIDRIKEIVRSAEKRFGQRIYMLQDCAHSFDAEWKGQSVINSGDGAFFGLGISKQITSIFGGMFTTNDSDIFGKLRAWREANFLQKSFLEILRRALYLPAVFAAFNPVIYNLTFWLQERTTMLKGLTDAYHLDQKIHFPPDFQHALSNLEARVGIIQLEKYSYIKEKRRAIADWYFENLDLPKNWILPPKMEGATYSHFVIRVPDREGIISRVAKKGVQLGRLIEYSMPKMDAYHKFLDPAQNFPVSDFCSSSLINLPIFPSLTEKDLEKIQQSLLKG